MSQDGLGLDKLGLEPGKVHRNLSVSELVEHALASGEAKLAANGALNVETGRYTGRSPKDKFVVEEEGSKDVIWWGEINQPVPLERYEKIFDKIRAHLKGKTLYVFDGYIGADPRYSQKVRIISERVYHSLFARTMFIRPAPGDEPNDPDIVVVDGCRLEVDPDVDGTRSEVFVGVHPTRKQIIIAGSHYAGEIKKGCFTMMNHILPAQGVFPMHCSANIGQKGDCALFFGLSGTGKTTLSADPNRRLIGDDEHGWTDEGVFNFEGGCYAKTIKLSKKGEPQIWSAIHYGTILENVVLDPVTRVPDYDDASLTENTRAAYPVEHIPDCVLDGTGPVPSNVIFLTCDAFGVMPPISKLNSAQAMYHFLSGYTAKVAGTERGVTEPTATFSPCFGGPFLTRQPSVYAHLLGERLEKTGAKVWLLNTGWNGTGNRIELEYTRAMVTAILDGKLDDVEYTEDPVFHVAVPKSVPGVPEELLNPVNTWKDKDAYNEKAASLATLFQDNFKKIGEGAKEDIVAAGPTA